MLVRVQPDVIRAILNMPEPRTTFPKEMRKCFDVMPHWSAAIDKTIAVDVDFQFAKTAEQFSSSWYAESHTCH